MATAPDYLHGSKLTVTIGGGTIPVTTSNVQYQAEEVDTTNVKDGGFDTHIYGFKNASFDGTMVVPASALPSLDVGTFYSATWAVTGGKSLSGLLGISSMTHTAGARGAYTVQFRGKFAKTLTYA